jgi:hypothetical protein
MANPTLAPLRPEVAAPKPGHLPAPFDDVRFTWDASDRYIELEYIGLAERLIECGAIEPAMVVKARKGEPKLRLDSAGHRFRREVKILRQPTLCAALWVVRRITDAKFAATLPGAPRGLRMKRLDWLDSHPGEVHVTRKHSRSKDYLTTFTAGTRESLIAAGFSESYFRLKLLARPCYEEFMHVGREWGTVKTLMRGYIEIEITRQPSVLDDEKVEKIPGPPPRSHLHLVVDNTAPAVSP